MAILVVAVTLKDSKWVKRLPRFGRMQTGGFVLGDLVAVLAMLCLLAAIFFPLLFRTKLIVQAGACLTDLHQIQNGWNLYNNENSGNFPYNVTGPDAANLNWVANFENYSGASSAASEALLANPQHSLLAPYVPNAVVYHCPADESKSAGLTGLPRVRSYSMSQAIGPNINGSVTHPNQGAWLGSIHGRGTVNTTGSFTVYLNNQMMIGRLQPSDLIVMVDENPDSINDGSWAFTMPTSPSQAAWVDKPTPLHGNAGSFSFADGHAVIRPWQRPAAIPQVSYSKQIGGQPVVTPWNPDVVWTASHISTVYRP